MTIFHSSSWKSAKSVFVFVCLEFERGGVIPGERIPREDYPPVLSIMCAPNITGNRVPLLRYKIISSSGVSRPSCTRPLRACDNSKGQRGKETNILKN